MTRLVDRDWVVGAVQDAGLEEDFIYEDYSGRGMYGDTCLGLSVGGDRDLVKFVVAMVASAEGRDTDWLEDVTSDGMGLGVIFYWRGVKLEEEA